MGKRNSWFGVTLPVWEAEKMGAGAITITFMLKGRLISKKNNQMAVVRKKEAVNWFEKRLKSGKKLTMADIKSGLTLTKAQFIGNKLYSECQKVFLPQLEHQKQFWVDGLGQNGLKFPLKKAKVSFRFYFKDKYRTDTLNKQQTFQDLLVEAGILADDDYKTLAYYSAESGCYKDKVVDNVAIARVSFIMPKKNKVKITDELK